MFSDNRDSHGNLVAHAVSFEVDGKSFAVNASKEVILSAGVVQTPQLLELSGLCGSLIAANPARSFEAIGY
jgi:hypothetical protein